MSPADVSAKLKHLNAQVAMAPQSSMAFSHGLPFCGQQSGMSSISEMPASSGDLTLTPALPAAGSIATDRAIRSVTMVRPTLMLATKYQVAGYRGQVTRSQAASRSLDDPSNGHQLPLNARRRSRDGRFRSQPDAPLGACCHCVPASSPRRLCRPGTIDYGPQGSELRLLFRLGPASPECGFRYQGVGHKGH